MHPEEIVHYIRIVKNEKSVLYLTYKIICGRQRLYALRLLNRKLSAQHERRDASKNALL